MSSPDTLDSGNVQKAPKLLLRACFGSIDPTGNLAGKNVSDPDSAYLAEVIDCIEIDGVKFSSSIDNEELSIVMEAIDFRNPELSPLVTPNYPAKVNVVKQIVHKSPEAKPSSSILNKFIRKTNKILSKEPCNKGKAQPANIVLIKEIEEIR